MGGGAIGGRVWVPCTTAAGPAGVQRQRLWLRLRPSSAASAVPVSLPGLCFLCSFWSCSPCQFACGAGTRVALHRSSRKCTVGVTRAARESVGLRRVPGVACVLQAMLVVAHNVGKQQASAGRIGTARGLGYSCRGVAQRAARQCVLSACFWGHAHHVNGSGRRGRMPGYTRDKSAAAGSCCLATYTKKTAGSLALKVLSPVTFVADVLARLRVRSSGGRGAVRCAQRLAMGVSLLGGMADGEWPKLVAALQPAR